MTLTDKDIETYNVIKTSVKPLALAMGIEVTRTNK